MKILAISYYDKFSRFFISIESNIKKTDTPISIQLMNIYPSGYLYSLLRFKNSKLISFNSWLKATLNNKKHTKTITTQDTYRGIKYKELIKFNTNYNTKPNTKSLLKQALSYIDLYSEYIKNNNPDFVLTIGDSRLAIECCLAVCKVNKVKTYCIEQGPFDTTIFDKKGVNAFSSLIEAYKKQSHIQVKNYKAFINRPPDKKYTRNPIYRGIDYIIDVLLNNTPIYPPDLKNHDKLFTISKKVYHNHDKLKSKPIFFLPLQVPSDVNMIYHSPNFSSQLEIIKNIHSNLPSNSILIIREHPVYKNLYNKKLYDYISNHENLILDNKTSLKSLLELANVVVVNNSTIGIEAIANYKTVVLLGNTYYKLNDICIIYSKNMNMKDVLNDALQYKLNKKNVDNFMSYFIFDYLIEGNISAKELISSSKISNILLHEYLNKKQLKK